MKMAFNNRDLPDVSSAPMGIGGSTIKDFQKYALGILLEFNRICEKNKITYFLMYGTLLGAVRHKGFIPWDDDADVVMSRDEFKRFRDACARDLNEQYDLVHYTEPDGCSYIFSRLRLKNSSYILTSEMVTHGRNAGIYIDIMVYDFLSDSPFRRKLQIKALLYLHRLVSPGYSQGARHLTLAEDAFLGFCKIILGKNNVIRIAEKVLASASEEKSSSVLINYFHPQIKILGICPKEHFQKCEYVPFEGYQLPIPYKSLSLLRLLYFNLLIDEGCVIHPEYEDEHAAILKGEFYRTEEVMFVIREKTHRRHIEVVFDEKHGNDFYDNHYIKLFDKKQNMRAAIKERYYRERAEKYLAKLNKNFEIAQACCNCIGIKICFEDEEYVRRLLAGEDWNELTDICQRVFRYNIMGFSELDEKSFSIYIELFLMVGYLASAYRFLCMMSKKYPDDPSGEYKRLRRIYEDFNEANIATFENRHDVIQNVINIYGKENGDKKYLLINTLKAILLYSRECFDDAETLLQQDIHKQSTWTPYYYLGLLHARRQSPEALELFYTSLDAVTYMPLLQLSLEQIYLLKPDEF